MADRDAILLERAREFRRRLSSDDRQAMDRIVEDLCVDPRPDQVLKFLVDSPPNFPYLYRDDRFFILYDELNNWTLAIWSIGYNVDELHLDTTRPEN